MRTSWIAIVAAALGACADDAGPLGDDGRAPDAGGPTSASAADVDTRDELGAALADQHAAGGHKFAAKPLHAAPLAVAVSSVA